MLKSYESILSGFRTKGFLVINNIRNWM